LYMHALLYIGTS